MRGNIEEINGQEGYKNDKKNIDKGDISIDDGIEKFKTVTTLASTRILNSRKITGTDKLKESLVISNKKYQSSKSFKFSIDIRNKKNEFQNHHQNNCPKNIANHNTCKNVKGQLIIVPKLIIFSSIYIEPELYDSNQYDKMVKYNTNT